MSNLFTKELPCPACAFPSSCEVWVVVNADDDPPLKDMLLSGELNLVSCSSCKHIFYGDQFLLYHEPSRELMAFVYPLVYTADRAAWEKKTQDDFAAAHNGTDGTALGYGPLTLFGPDALLNLLESDDDVHIQAEIVSHLASDAGLFCARIPAALARERDVPPLIPTTTAHELRNETILPAVAEILRLNDRLTRYAALQNRLNADPALAGSLSQKSI